MGLPSLQDRKFWSDLFAIVLVGFVKAVRWLMT